MASDIDLGIKIRGDGDDAVKELKQIIGQLNGIDEAQKKVVRSTNILTKARAKSFAISAALKALEIGRSFINYAKSVDDFSRAVNISAEKAQSLAFAAKMTGTNLQAVESSMLNLAREAGAGNNAFSLLGIDFQKLKTMSPSDLFREIASQAASGTMNSSQMAAAIKLLGSNGAETFEAMSRGFNEFEAEAQSSGAVISSEVFERIFDSAVELKETLIQISETIARNVLPGFTNWGEEALKWIDKLTVALDYLMGTMTFYKTLATEMWSGESLNPFKRFQEAHKKAVESGREKMRQSKEQRSNRIALGKGGITAGDIQFNLGQSDRISGMASALGGRQPVDSLAKTGLFATAGASAAQSIQMRQVSLLSRIASHTKATKDAVEDN